MKKMTALQLAALTTFFFLVGTFQALASGTAQPLVSTNWVSDNIASIKNPNQSQIRFIEVSKKGYDKGHIPGALHMKWGRDTFDPTTDHMVLSLGQIERLMGKLAAPPSAHIVLYDGDGKVHHVARVYWTLKFWNYKNVSIMDGGKALWQKEGRALTSETIAVTAQNFEVSYPPNTKIRAMYSPDIIEALATSKSVIVDSRPEPFYNGEKYSLNKWVRSGHITGAVNLPTLYAMNEDKTYMSTDKLNELYSDEDLTKDKKIITYCDTGVLAAHQWFVLHELLGYKTVKLYDGSMREYANRFDTPMEPGIIGGNFPDTPIQQVGKSYSLPHNMSKTK